MSVTLGVRAMDTSKLYRRDVRRHALFTREEERELGKLLVAARVRYWRAVLSYAPFCVAALDYITIRGLSDATKVEMDRLRDAVRTVRTRSVASDVFYKALDATARQLAFADPSCEEAHRIAADVERVAERDRDIVVMKVRFPYQGSRPFAAYREQIYVSARALHEIRERFVNANLRLALHAAHRQGFRLPLEDRVQAANLGLLRAVDKFDPTRGFRFSTYAMWQLRAFIQREEQNTSATIRIPVHLADDVVRIYNAEVNRTTSLGHPARLRPVTKAYKIIKRHLDRCIPSPASVINKQLDFPAFAKLNKHVACSVFPLVSALGCCCHRPVSFLIFRIARV